METISDAQRTGWNLAASNMSQPAQVATELLTTYKFYRQAKFVRIKSSGEVFYHYRAKVSNLLTSPHFVTSLMSSFSVVEEEIERDTKTDRHENVQSSDNIAGTLGADTQQP